MRRIVSWLVLAVVLLPAASIAGAELNVGAHQAGIDGLLFSESFDGTKLAARGCPQSRPNRHPPPGAKPLRSARQIWLEFAA